MAKELPKALNLLEPTVEPTSTWDRIYEWVFTVGRYIIVSVELVVLIAFVSRFILDQQNNDLKASIESKIGMIQAQSEIEEEIRGVQSVLGNISAMVKNQTEMSSNVEDVLEKIPDGVTLLDFIIDPETVKAVCSAPDYATVEEMEKSFRNDSKYGDVKVSLSKSGSAASEVEFSIIITFAEE